MRDFSQNEMILSHLAWEPHQQGGDYNLDKVVKKSFKMTFLTTRSQLKEDLVNILFVNPSMSIKLFPFN